MNTTSKHPVDYDSLHKGDYIPPEVTQSIIRVNREDKMFSLRLTALAEHIEKELIIRNKHATCVCEHDGIRLLTDSEAAIYLRGVREQSINRMRRTLRRMVRVDTGALTECERQSHDKELLTTGRMVQMIRRARREIPALESHKSSSPKIESTLKTA